jgi:hypothetical protein
MKTLPFLLPDELRFSPNPPAIYLNHARPPKVRVALFGSFHGGYHVLKELLSGELADRVTVVGVATDDPTQPFIHAEKRLWQYPHTRDEELLVPRFAAAQGLPVYTGRVKTPEFFDQVFTEWRPQLCLMATFGQKIPTALIHFPALGFYNFHHAGLDWPSYPGPDPIAAMVRDGRSHLVLTIHKVSDVIDDGEFVARSHPVAIPDGINAVGMHRIIWPQMGPFIRREVGALLGAASPYPLADESLVLQESPIAYRVGSRRSGVGQTQTAFAQWN